MQPALSASSSHGALRFASSRRLTTSVVSQSQGQGQQQRRGSIAGSSSSGASSATPRLQPAAAFSLNAGPIAPARFRPDSVLPLVSSAVEASAQIATFEAFAGRSAMIGFFVALVIESTTAHSTFNSFAPSQAAELGSVLLLSLAAAGALAAAAARRPASEGVASSAPAWEWLGQRVHESVLSSLTGAQRSASGVTQHKVDEVVDFVVDRCLTQAVHPVFGPLRDARDAGSTVVTVMDDLLAGEDRPDFPQ